jgi:hypothetical protein
MKMLWCGDVHATVRELEDAQNLVDYIAKIAKDEGDIDRIHFAGDLYDNFSLVNTQVMEFWKRAFAKLEEYGDVEALKGNHDMSNDSSSTAHALIAHEEVTVFDKPHLDEKCGILYMPFIRNPEEFVAEALKYAGKAKLLFCHQDFTGAKYENGFYSKEGVDPSLLPFEIISGHIHAPYAFGNVWYPGAPRWRTLSDAAEQRRHIYLFEIEDGEINQDTLVQFPTSDVCRRIVEMSLIHDGPDMLSQPIEKNADYRVSITGPEDFVRATEIRVRATISNAKIATVILDESVKLRESEGISASFQKWFDAFNPPFGTDKDVLRKMVAERIHV